MLLAFAEKTLSGLVFSALMVGIITFFEHDLVFDKLVLIAFIAFAISFRRNIDLVTISSIFIAERALEELMWVFFDYSIWFKIPAYLIFLCTIFFVSNGPLRAFALIFVLLGAVIEGYWYLTDYSAPEILWFYYVLTVSIVVRRLLRMRVFWMIEFNPKLNPKPLFLDSQLLFANAMFIGLLSIHICEYYIRHVLGYTDFIYAYSLFSPIAGVVSLFMIYMIIIQSIHHLKAIELDA